MRRYEGIVNLGHPQPAPSVSLEQHCSAMRMDDLESWTANRLGFAIRDARKDVARMGKVTEKERER